MRPVDKGDHPTRDGVPIPFRSYRDAKPFLLSRLGPYCSYCEVRFADGLHVEHILPKNEYQALLLSYENFLLSCGRCNSFKNGRQSIDPRGEAMVEDLARYFWPDRDGTHGTFTYLENGLIEPAQGLDDATRHIAAETLHMFALDKDADDEDPVLVSDQDGNKVPQGDPRFRERLETWVLAMELLDTLEASSPEDREYLIEQISTFAKYRGHFSIWMAAFSGSPDARGSFLEVFEGTARETCYGPATEPVARPGGRP